VLAGVMVGALPFSFRAIPPWRLLEPCCVLVGLSMAGGGRPGPPMGLGDWLLPRWPKGVAGAVDRSSAGSQ